MIKATAYVGGARAVEIACALVRQKAIAILLGPAGYGVLAWIRNVCDLLITLPLLGMNGSAVRFISYHAQDGDHKAVRRVLTTTLGVALATVPVTLAVYFFFARRHLLANGFGPEYLGPFRLALCSVPLMSAAACFNAFLIGFKAIRRTTLLIVLNSLATLLIGVPLIVGFALWGAFGPTFEVPAPAGAGWVDRLTSLLDALRGNERAALYGLWGAAVGLVVLSVVNVGLSVWQFVRVHAIPLRGFSLRVARRMSGVAASDWLGGTFSLIALLVVRSHMAKHYGEDVLGLYNSIFVMCSLYLGPLVHSLIFYTYPRMSELREHSAIVDEINGTLRVVLLLSTPAMVLMATGIKPLLLILYSSQFVLAAPLLPFQLFGEWFRLPMRSMGWALMGQERVKPYIFFDMLFYVILISVTLVTSGLLAFTHQGHLMTIAPCVGYAAGAIVGTAGNYWAVRRVFGFRLRADNALLAALSIPLLLFTIFYTPGGAREVVAAAIKIGLLGLWVWLVVKPEEWREVAETLKRRLLKRKG